MWRIQIEVTLQQLFVRGRFILISRRNKYVKSILFAYGKHTNSVLTHMAVHLLYTVNLLHTNKCYHDLYLKCTSTNWPPKSTIPVYYYCAIVDCILKLRYVRTRISLYWKCTQSNRSEIPLYCFCTAWLLQHKNNNIIYKQEFHL